MELKNISEKVISIGTTVVMPDKSVTISEKQAFLPSIKALIKQGYVSVKKKSSTTGKDKQAEDVPAPAESPEASGDFTSNAESPAEETADDKSAASKRGKNK